MPTLPGGAYTLLAQGSLEFTAKSGTEFLVDDIRLKAK